MQHVADIVRNANLFYARWGSWPMGGWLQDFRRLGLIEGGHGTTPCTLAAHVAQRA